MKRERFMDDAFPNFSRRTFTRNLTIGIGGLVGIASLPTVANAASLNYSVPAGPFVQDGWRWCRKCQILFFSLNSTLGVCPAGGAHDPTGSWALALHANDSNTAGQHGWKWCHQCQGLFFPEPNNQNGSCPGAFNIGGLFRQGHDMTGSADYTVWVQSTAHPGPPDPSLVDFGHIQNWWGFCAYCHNLWYTGNGTAGVCIANGSGHTFSNSWDLGVIVH